MAGYWHCHAKGQCRHTCECRAKREHNQRNDLCVSRKAGSDWTNNPGNHGHLRCWTFPYRCWSERSVWTDYPLSGLCRQPGLHIRKNEVCHYWQRTISPRMCWSWPNRSFRNERWQLDRHHRCTDIYRLCILFKKWNDSALLKRLGRWRKHNWQ